MYTIFSIKRWLRQAGSHVVFAIITPTLLVPNICSFEIALPVSTLYCTRDLEIVNRFNVQVIM